MYFNQTKYISNSDLTALKHELQLREKKDLSKAFNFGNLVEAMIEEKPVDEFAALSSAEELARARLMDEAAKADRTIQLFLETHKKQHEFYREQFAIETDEGEICIPARGKLDLCRKAFRSGGDFKTTAAKTQRQFVESIFLFDYDRAAAWYMDLARLDNFTLIGIGKEKNSFTKKYPVFKYIIVRDQPDFRRGQLKYAKLAWQYYHLIYNLNL
jgi:hypothetical protein